MSYNYCVRINRKAGEFKNPDREYPARKGPNVTCTGKHIAAVAPLLVKFRETRIILIPKGCTYNPQTFHKPKKSFQAVCLINVYLLLMTVYF